MILVGSWLRPFSMDIKSCHKGRSRVSSQALRYQQRNKQTNKQTQEATVNTYVNHCSALIMV